MKKKQMYYIIVWIALISLFNVLFFVTPDEINGIKTFSGAFWPGYVFITIAFLGHLVFSIVCLSESNYGKKVLNIPLAIISYFELAAMVAIGLACMFVPGMPNWLGIILCYAILVFSILFLMSAKVVGENAASANQSLNAKVFQMREITNQASELIAMSKDADTRALLQSVYEAIRYSDPVSTDETQPEECEMIKLLAEIKALIECEKSETIRTKAETIVSFAIQLIYAAKKQIPEMQDYWSEMDGIIENA